MAGSPDFAHLKRPKAGRPDFGWSIILRKNFLRRGWIAGSSPAMTKWVKTNPNAGLNGPAQRGRGNRPACAPLAMTILLQKDDSRPPRGMPTRARLPPRAM